MKHNNTAILIFANTALEDASRKAIGNSEKLFHELNNHTIRTVQSTKLPYFHFTEDQQTGRTFGERFTNAIKDIFAQGFDNVITIGNDTPHLKTSQLVETAHKLQNEKFVLGPSKDGGFYLMGLHKSQFNEQLFVKLPWQSRTLAKKITRLLSKSKVKIVTLEVLQDIDSALDIPKILNTFKKIARNLIKLLIVLNRTISVFTINHNRLVTLFWSQKQFNKGSPLELNS